MITAKPISKAQATSQLTIRMEEFLNKAIPVINRMLENFVSGSQRMVYESQIGLDDFDLDLRARAREEIIGLYRSQGWTVSHTHGDQRDNDSWFTFR